MRTYEDGCRCKHCGNSLVATSACTTPGTQQQIPTELLEIEQEEVLQDDVVRRDYAQRCVGEEDVGGERNQRLRKRMKNEKLTVVICLGSELWCICYLVSCLTHEGERVWFTLFVLAQRILGNSSLLSLLYTHIL